MFGLSDMAASNLKKTGKKIKNFTFLLVAVFNGLLLNNSQGVLLKECIFLLHTVDTFMHLKCIC